MTTTFRPLPLMLAIGLAAAAFSATPAFAQEATPAPAGAGTVQRDINQETRIRNGLQNGQLTTREAAVLQREEAKTDRMQANAMKDGTLTPREQRRLARQQNQVSRDIAEARHNGVDGNPNSASSQRMQQATQRDINQQQRIENGLQSGQLTTREAGQLERGQARDDRQQFRRGRDGNMSAADSAAVNNRENRQSERIWRKKHNNATAG